MDITSNYEQIDARYSLPEAQVLRLPYDATATDAHNKNLNMIADNNVLISTLTDSRVWQISDVTVTVVEG